MAKCGRLAGTILPKTFVKMDKVYQAIVEHKLVHDGNSPTIRQLRDVCKLSSTSEVNYLLRYLLKDGRLKHIGIGGIEVTDGSWFQMKVST